MNRKNNIQRVKDNIEKKRYIEGRDAKLKSIWGDNYRDIAKGVMDAYVRPSYKMVGFDKDSDSSPLIDFNNAS